MWVLEVEMRRDGGRLMALVLVVAVVRFGGKGVKDGGCSGVL